MARRRPSQLRIGVAAAAAVIASGLAVFVPVMAPSASASTTFTPVVVSGAGQWRAATIVVSQGADTTYPHACAITTIGGVKCWGHLQYGEGGFGGQIGTASYPVNMKLVGANAVARVSQANGPTLATGGDRNTCVIFDATGITGGVQCSGLNRSGAVGRGNTVELVLTPVLATQASDNADLTGVTSIVGGGYDDANQHFCALKNGGVYCWGYGGNGQLGDNTNTTRTRAVVAIPEGSGVTSIAAGAAHSCAVYTSATPVTVPGSSLPAANGGVACWGYNPYGALGDNTSISRAFPARVLSAPGTALTNVAEVAAGVWHTCARLTDGTVRCWGHNGQGMLGNNSTGTDRYLANTTVTDTNGSGTLSGVTSITAGYRGSCAVVAGGELRCWGQNSNGQLGDGTTTDRAYPAKVIDVGQTSTSTVLLGQMGTASMGSYVTCGIKTDGRALCWGRWDNGTLGSGTTSNTSSPMYVNGAGPGVWSTATMAMSSRGDDSGSHHGCAVTTQPELKCWGYNADGQAGAAAGGTNDAPVSIPLDGVGAGANPVPATGTDGSQIAASNLHTCVIFNSSTITGGVQCFGVNDQGQLGAGNTTAAPGVRKVVVKGAGPSSDGVSLTGVTQISASGREDQTNAVTTCAVAGGGVFCWGNGDPGLMGDGAITDRSSPVQVPGFPVGSGASEVAVGRYHACARWGSGPNAGKASCWGWNAWGQLSNGEIVTGYTKAGFLINGTTATFVKSAAGTDMTGIDQISVGAYHTCFLRSGAVSCAGYGGQYELGNGAAPGNTTYAVAAASPMNSGVSSISTGTRYTCAVKGGTPYCVGKNDQGQLGRGTSTPQEASWLRVIAVGETNVNPTAMTGISTAKGDAIAAGGWSACARKTSGELDCWGYETTSQLGDGSLTPTPRATFSGLSCNTASTSTWGSATAPAGTGSATFYLTGGGGAAGDTYDGIGGAGGSGGVIVGTVPISAGQVLWAKLGCGGTDSSTAYADGYTKGGRATSVYAGGGGGSSALCIGTATASCGSGAVVAIASGGGGGARGSGTGACRNTDGGTGGSGNLGSQSTGQKGGTGYGGGRGGNGDFDRATTSLTYPTANGGGGGGGLGQGPGQSSGSDTPNNTGGTGGTGSFGSGGNGANATSNPPGPAPVSNEGDGGTSVAGPNSIYGGGGGGGYTGGGAGAAGIDGSCTTGVWAGGGGGGAGSSWIRSTAPAVSVSGAGEGFANAGGLSGSCNDTLGTNAGFGATAGSGARGCHGNVIVYWNQDLSTIGGSASPAANGAGWNNTNVTVTFTCSSAVTISCSAPTVLSGDGAGQSVVGTVTDGYGRSTTATVSNINIDKTNPTGSGAPTTSANGAGWYKDDVVIDWSCSDALSGVATCPSDSTITGEGSALSASAAAVDNAGNSATLTSPTVKIDRTKPSTSISAIPTWSTSNVTVTLTPTDGLSGIASTSYTVDGGGAQSGTSIDLTSDGVHTITYESTDNAGNVESTQTATVRIDKTAPTISAGVSPAPNGGGWNNSDVTVTFTCSDGTSGVASCSPPATVTTDTASQVVSGSASDVAGNTSGTSATVKLDKTAPTISGSTAPAANAAGWNNTDVDVTFTCNDATSGIASCPGGTTIFDETSGGSLSGTAYDAAGNSAGTSVTGVKIDKTDPSITANVSGSVNGYGYRVAPVTVSFTCSDALSGIDVGACPADVVLTGSGTFDVPGTVLDLAGNEAQTSVTVDVSNPPSAADDSVTAQRHVATAITLGASDPNGDPLTSTIVDEPTKGLLDCTGSQCTYTSGPTETGNDSFTFRVSDGTADSNLATVSIALVNDDPVATPLSFDASRTNPTDFDLAGTDANGDTLTFAIDSPPTKGSASCNGAGHCTYTPIGVPSGSDEVTFTVDDGYGGTDTATVTIALTNHPPTANSAGYTVTKSIPKSFLLSGDDADEDSLSFTIETYPTNGTLGCVSNVCTYTASITTGTDSFTYTASDGQGGTSAPATISFTISLPRVSVGEAQVLEPDVGSDWFGVMVPITLSAPLTTDVTIAYYTENGTATGGVSNADYRTWGTPTAPKTIKIPAGQTWNAIAPPIMPDSISEADETFTVRIASITTANGSVVGAGDAAATVTIIDNYRPGGDPLMVVQDGWIYEGDAAAGSKAQFSVQFSKPLAAPLTLTYLWTPGTALEGNAGNGIDWKKANTGTYTIPAGTMWLRTVDFKIWGDTVTEDNETLQLTVLLPDGAPIIQQRPTGTTTILNDD